MKRSLVAATSLVGLWSAAAPLLLSWGMPLTVVAGNVIPGVLTVVLGVLACTLRADAEAPDLDRQLVQHTCSYLVLLGAWLLLVPILMGYPLGAASTYLGAVLPGAAVMGLALANGYLGWREAYPN